MKAIPTSIIALALLAGCAKEPPPRVVEITRLTVPEPPLELTTCKESVVLPTGSLDARDVANLILRLNHAHRDCRMTLEALVGWLHQARIDAGP